MLLLQCHVPGLRFVYVCRTERCAKSPYSSLYTGSAYPYLQQNEKYLLQPPIVELWLVDCMDICALNFAKYLRGF